LTFLARFDDTLSRQQHGPKFSSVIYISYLQVDSTHWFYHWRRTGGRHNCITYLLADVVARPSATPATPTSACWHFA